jgi:hypothetical protein
MKNLELYPRYPLIGENFQRTVTCQILEKGIIPSFKTMALIPKGMMAPSLSEIVSSNGSVL